MTDRRYQVAWTESATADLEAIVAYLAATSTEAAGRQYERLLSRARSLERLPRRGRVVPELARFGLRSWRESVVAPYRLVYRVTGQQVLVLAVLDARRDLEDVLLERILRAIEPRDPDAP